MGVDNDFSKNLVSTADTFIKYNQELIKSTEEAMNQRLAEGANEAMVSHFREQVERLTTQNTKLQKAKNEAQQNPTDESVTALQMALM